MKKKLYKLMLLFVAITMCTSIFTSCNEEELPGATRLFRPILADDNIVPGLDADTVPYIKISWDKYTNVTQYVLKIVASDGTDSATITTDTTSYTFSNLKFDTEYNIYIHSVNTGNGLESKDFIATTFTPDFPTMLNNISTSNIIDTQVRVTWYTLVNDEATVYDTLKVYDVTADTLVVTSAVSASELESGTKIIRKLHASTKYRLEAFNKGKYKGKKLFTTTAPESYEGLVIDLRGLTEDESYKYFSSASGSVYANAIDSLVQLYPDQDMTIVLQGGVTYRMPSIMLPATTGVIRFVTGLSLNGEAQFAVSGNFDVAAGLKVGGIQFKKIFFTDAPLEGKSRTSDANYGSTYLINLSGTGSELGSFDLTQCSIKYKRGICRIKAAAIIDTLNIDNCVIDSISGYGITNVDHADAQIINMNVSNSTFSNCDKLFVNTKPTAHTVNQFKISNSTFVYCGTDKVTWFDFNGCTVASGVIISNCLFGRPGTRTTGALLNGAIGWRGTSSPICSDCYFTSDLNWALGSDGITPNNPLEGTTVDTDSPGSFAAPESSDFTVTSSALKKVSAGDPRWY